MIDNGESRFYVQLREYSEKAIRFLAERCPSGPFESIGLDEWRRDSDGVFRRGSRTEPPWRVCFYKHRDEIHSWVEYHRLVEALRSDSRIALHLDQLVGVGGSAHRIDTSSVTDRFIFRIPDRLGELRFDSALFDTGVTELSSDLSRTELTFTMLAPIRGLELETAPLELERGLALDRLTDDEICRCLGLGMLPEPGAAGLPLRTIEHLSGVRVRYALPKVVGSIDDVRLASAHAHDGAAGDSATIVLQALRVFKPSKIALAGLLWFCEDWPLSGGTQYRAMNQGATPWTDAYRLTQAEEQNFAVLWAELKRAAPKLVLARSLRRFSYAAERERSDDRLVDLMIAAESLFLGGSDDPRDRGEMRYKLGLRAGFFIDSSEFTPQEVCRFMRRAYDARSAIVHAGTEPDSDELRSPKGDRLRLHEFVSLAGELMRIALRKAITLSRGSAGSLLDWDAEMLRRLGNRRE